MTCVRIMLCIMLWCSLALTSRARSHWRHVPKERVSARKMAVTKWEAVLRSGKAKKEHFYMQQAGLFTVRDR